jgi:nucleotide-binding universal stress UspA family protein
MTALTLAPTRSGAPAFTDLDVLPVAPIVAAVDASAASWPAVEEAVILAAGLDVPLVFVYVRRGPTGFFGGPVYQRRLTGEMARAQRVLDRALRIATIAEVEAEAEIVEGSPKRRIIEFARDRRARLVVVGSRRRRLGRSVACAVARAAELPIVVAAPWKMTRAALPIPAATRGHIAAGELRRRKDERDRGGELPHA